MRSKLNPSLLLSLQQECVFHRQDSEVLRCVCPSHVLASAPLLRAVPGAVQPALQPPHKGFGLCAGSSYPQFHACGLFQTLCLYTLSFSNLFQLLCLREEMESTGNG